MNYFRNKILQHGRIMNTNVLNLDAILNHQVEPDFMMKAGQAFAKLYKDESITKVVTIESSGISVAFATALELQVPFIFARRKKSLTTDADSYCERVPSFTKGFVTDIVVSRHLLGPQDRVLLIDDIIANGDAARGLMRIVEASGAELAGWGIVVEKSFQAGARTIRELGVRVESLVKIQSLEKGAIQFGD